MNEHSNPSPEQRLGEGLRAQAERLDATGTTMPVSLDDVRGAARGVQRRRRVAAGLAAAAVVAVAVPVASLAAGGARTTGSGPADDATVVASATTAPTPTDVVPSPSESATTEPSTTPQQDPTPTVAPSTTPDTGGALALTAAGLTRGSAPRLAYLTGATRTDADGSTRDLGAAYLDVAPYHGGWLATEPGEDGYEVVTLDASGTEVDRAVGDAHLVTSDDGTLVGWSTGTTLHRAIGSGMSDTVDDQELTTQVAPVGFLGGGELVYTAGSDTASPSVHVTDLAGKDTRLAGLRGAGGTSSARGGLVSGLVSASDDGSCWVVRSVATGRDAFRTCDWSLGAFSPDGRYVAAGPAYRDGIGDSEVAVLDARTGDVVAHWQRQGRDTAFVTTVAWEDDNDLLAPFFEAGRWHLLRLDVGGRLTDSLAPVTASMDDAPWHFSD